MSSPPGASAAGCSWRCPTASAYFPSSHATPDAPADAPARGASAPPRTLADWDARACRARPTRASARGTALDGRARSSSPTSPRTPRRSRRGRAAPAARGDRRGGRAALGDRRRRAARATRSSSSRRRARAARATPRPSARPVRARARARAPLAALNATWTRGGRGVGDGRGADDDGGALPAARLPAAPSRSARGVTDLGAAAPLGPSSRARRSRRSRPAAAATTAAAAAAARSARRRVQSAVRPVGARRGGCTPSSSCTCRTTRRRAPSARPRPATTTTATTPARPRRLPRVGGVGGRAHASWSGLGRVRPAVRLPRQGERRRLGRDDGQRDARRLGRAPRARGRRVPPVQPLADARAPTTTTAAPPRPRPRPPGPPGPSGGSHSRGVPGAVYRLRVLGPARRLVHRRRRAPLFGWEACAATFGCVDACPVAACAGVAAVAARRGRRARRKGARGRARPRLPRRADRPRAPLLACSEGRASRTSFASFAAPAGECAFDGDGGGGCRDRCARSGVARDRRGGVRGRRGRLSCRPRASRRADATRSRSSSVRVASGARAGARGRETRCAAGAQADRSVI